MRQIRLGTAARMPNENDMPTGEGIMNINFDRLIPETIERASKEGYADLLKIIFGKMPMCIGLRDSYEIFDKYLIKFTVEDWGKYLK